MLSIKPYLTMYPAGQHPLFPYTSEHRAQIGKRHGITEQQLQRDVETLIDWVKQQPHLAEAGIYPRMAELFLTGAKGSMERAKQRVDAFYRHRLNHPEFFKNRIELLNNTERKIWHSAILVAIPKPYEGRRLCITKITDFDHFKVEDLVLNSFMIGDMRFVNECSDVDEWILDLKGVTLGFIMKLNPIAMAKSCLIMHEGIGLRISNFNMINCSIAPIAQAVINVARQFLSKKMQDRIKFHKSLEDLHKCIPREYLPKDYGGELSSMEEFRDKYEIFMRSEKTKQFLIEACNLVSDESKRPKSTNSEDCLAGTFRNLDVD